MPDLDLRVYAVWLPMLATDARGEWSYDTLPDDRVRHFWDGDRTAALWFADEDVGGYGYQGVAWDVFFLYRPEATDLRQPIASGATIVGDSGKLERALRAFTAG
jgi:hypothetical protein